MTYPASLVLDATAVLFLPCPGDTGGPPGGRPEALSLPDARGAGERPISSQQGGPRQLLPPPRDTHTGDNDHNSCDLPSASYVPPSCSALDKHSPHDGPGAGAAIPELQGMQRGHREVNNLPRIPQLEVAEPRLRHRSLALNRPVYCGPHQEKEGDGRGILRCELISCNSRSIRTISPSLHSDLRSHLHIALR